MQDTVFALASYVYFGIFRYGNGLKIRNICNLILEKNKSSEHGMYSIAYEQNNKVIKYHSKDMHQLRTRWKCIIETRSEWKLTAPINVPPILPRL